MATYADIATLHVPATGAYPPASWGTQIRDNFEAIIRDSPTAGVYNNTNISIPDSTVTALTFNTERWDNASMHTGSSSQLVIPTGWAGKYIVNGVVAATANSSGSRQLGIRKNGSTFIGRQSGPAPAGTVSPHLSISRIVSLAAGDYVELTYYQDTGGALNALYLADESPNFEIFFFRF